MESRDDTGNPRRASPVALAAPSVDEHVGRERDERGDLRPDNSRAVASSARNLWPTVSGLALDRAGPCGYVCDGQLPPPAAAADMAASNPSGNKRAIARLDVRSGGAAAVTGIAVQEGSLLLPLVADGTGYTFVSGSREHPIRTRLPVIPFQPATLGDLGSLL